MRPLACPLCGNNSVLKALCRSAGERLIGLLGASPFRCQLCTHRFLAFRWGRSYPTHLVDRREHPRIPVRLILSFSGDRHRGEGTLTDISMGGCLVQSTMPAKVDEIYYLRIHFSEQDPPVELAAIVRSVGARGIGFKFLRAAREDARLAEFLQAQGCGAASAVQPKAKDNRQR